MAVSPDYSHFVKTDAEGRSRIDLAIDGITCAACLGDIETAMKRLPGVMNARLNLTSHRLAVTFDAARIQAGGLTARWKRSVIAPIPMSSARSRPTRRRDSISC